MKNLKQVLLAVAIVCYSITGLKAQKKPSKATPAQIKSDDEALKRLKGMAFLKQSPTGLLYSIPDYEKGDKPKPAKFRKVRVQYSLRTVDYKEILRDFGTGKKAIVEVAPEELPYGIQECIKMMNIGAMCTFYMPAKLTKYKGGQVGGGRALFGSVKLHAVVL